MRLSLITPSTSLQVFAPAVILIVTKAINLVDFALGKCHFLSWMYKLLYATLHVVKLLVECQRHIVYLKVGMFNYCFIRVSEYMMVFVMVFASSFGK